MFVEFIIKLKGLVFIPLLSRYFGALNYGVWSQFNTLIATVSPLIILGTDSAVMRYLPGDSREEQKRYYSAWCCFLLGVTALVAFFLVVYRRNVLLLFFGNKEKYASFMLLAVISLYVTLMLNLLRNWYRIVNNAKSYGIFAIIQAACDIAILLVILFFKKGVYEFILYSLILQLIMILFICWLIMKAYGWEKPDFNIIPKLLKYGLPLLPASYATWGLNSMDRLFLVKYSTISEIGIYGLAYGLGYMAIQMIINPIWSMYANTAAELYNQKKTEDLQKLFDRSINLILFLTLPAMAIIAVLSRHLVLVLATAEFLSGAQLIVIITSAYLFLMLASYYEISLGLVHKQYLATVSVFIACLINLACNMLLIPRYGIKGAAVATAVGFLSQLVFSFIFANKFMPLKNNFVFSAKILLVSILLGVVMHFLLHFFPNTGILPLLLLACAGILIYIILLFLFKIVSKERIMSTINFILEKD